MLQHDIFNVSHPFRPSSQDDALASPRISPKQLPSSSSVVGLRDWQGKGPARTKNSVFPGVNSWPTSPVLGATTATPPPIPSPPGTSLLSSTVTSQPTRTIPLTPYTPSPSYQSMSPSYPPQAQRAYGNVAEQHDDNQEDPWYGWLCCLRRRARSRIERIA